MNAQLGNKQYNVILKKTLVLRQSDRGGLPSAPYVILAKNPSHSKATLFLSISQLAELIL